MWHQIKTIKRSTIAKHIFPWRDLLPCFSCYNICDTHRFLWKIMRDQNKIICQNHEKVNVWAGIFDTLAPCFLLLEKMWTLYIVQISHLMRKENILDLLADLLNMEMNRCDLCLKWARALCHSYFKLQAQC